MWPWKLGLKRHLSLSFGTADFQLRMEIRIHWVLLPLGHMFCKGLWTPFTKHRDENRAGCMDAPHRGIASRVISDGSCLKNRHDIISACESKSIARFLVRGLKLWRLFLVGRDLSISSLCSVFCQRKRRMAKAIAGFSSRPKCGGRAMPFFWRRKEFRILS